jgi:hypothetical protein
MSTHTYNLLKRADEDYLQARLSFHNELIWPYYTSAQQCLEKYLKVACLFEDLSVKDYGHDLVYIYNFYFNKLDESCGLYKIQRAWYFKLKRLQESLLKLGIDVGEICSLNLIDYLSHVKNIGMNRYCQGSCYSLGGELLYLDSAVWILRQYATFIGGALGYEGRPIRYMALPAIQSGKGSNTHGYLGQICHQSQYQKHREIFLKDNLAFQQIEDMETFHVSLASNGINHPLGLHYQRVKGSQNQEVIREFTDTAKNYMKSLRCSKPEIEDIKRMIKELE